MFWWLSQLLTDELNHSLSWDPFGSQGNREDRLLLSETI